MEYRQLGASGLRVPVLSFGTATFGGGNDFFKAWGNTQVDEAKKLVNLCLDAGVNFFDTANVYSRGISETILGKALEGLRNDVLISTKATFTMGDGINDYGSSRFQLVKQAEDSLRRLQTDHIDIYHMHGFDATTPIQETLRALDDLVTSGKVRYIACSNFFGLAPHEITFYIGALWLEQVCSSQAYYSLLNREFEWELMPLGIEEKVSTIVWSPLASGQLSGKFRRGQPIPESSRTVQGGSHGPATNFEHLYNIVDALDEVAEETGKSVAQVSLNWLLQRPTVANIIIGARNEEQLKQNLDAVGWNLTTDQVKKLDAASEVPPIYPYWHQRQNTKLVPLPIQY